MSQHWPRGQSESQKLEFKRGDILKRMKDVAREVVAMLNASGGEIWIGVAEEAGLAVRVDPIESIEERKQALWNHLVDTLDPIPKPEEISVEAVNTPDGSILKIEVTEKGARKPYAYRDDGLRFVQRLGARVRPMASQDLRELFAPQAASKAAPESFLKPLLEERDRLVEEGQPRYWIRLQPSHQLGLNYAHESVDLCLTKPEATGNRATGVTFLSPYGQLRTRQNQRCLEVGKGEKRLTRVHKDGWIDCVAPLTSIGKEPLIWPLLLMEMSASVLRLAKAVYENGDIRDESKTRTFEVAADLALIGARGWKLPPWSPKWPMDPLFEELDGLEANDLLLERPLVLQDKEVVGAPDRCAYRLLIPVYEAFGYSEDKIPSEFDRRSGRLLLPS